MKCLKLRNTPTFGGAGLSGLQGTGEFDPKDRHQVLKDEYGLKTARETARGMLEPAQIIEAGKQRDGHYQ